MIVCCGEALIDMLPRQSSTGEPCFAPHAGGAIFNTAIALGRLGVPTGFFSGLSHDMFGALLARTLEQSLVGTHYCARSNRPTTLAFVELRDGQASYHFYDENSAGRMITETDLPAFGDDVKALMFGGISLLPEPCASTYEVLMARERSKRVIMLDPNIRPGFITDEKAYLERLKRLFALADIVKLSDEDLNWIGARFGSDGEALIASLLADNATLVLVTRGSQGADGYAKSGKTSAVGKPVSVIDTIGAGDTFNAGVLASLHRQGLLDRKALAGISVTQIEQALQLANKVAAVTVSRAGANPPWSHELG